jgi:histidine triad (HIT) family protein
MDEQNVVLTEKMDYKENCVLCNHKLEPRQKVILSNENCFFTQMLQEILIGSGLIIPKKHRANVFELTEEEWIDTFDLLKKVRTYLDEKHQPDGYNVAWNSYSAAG